MKKIISLTKALIVIFSLAQFTSCDKSDSTPTETHSVQGLWIGTYSTNGQSTNTDTYYSFIIKPGGSLLVETKFLNQQEFAVGTWSLSGNTLSCVYTYVYAASGHVGTVQSATVTWDNSNKLASGTWLNTTPSNGLAGTFTLTKVN
jgi:hypothetical protein